MATLIFQRIPVLRLLLSAVPIVLLLQGPAGAQETATDPSGATADAKQSSAAATDSLHTPAAQDSLSFEDALDRLRALEALPDSLSAGAIRDSLLAADGADSLSAESDSLSFHTPDAPGPDELPALLPYWAADAALGAADLNRLLAQGMDDIVEALPSGSIRVNGERGMAAFTNLSPVDPAAFEMLYDGVPTRSPADLDPGVWDRSAMGLNAVATRPVEGFSAGGGGVLLAVSDPAQPGRTVFRTHFHKARYQSYLRGISITTPRARRTVRFDFEEWKTSDGYNFSANAALGAVAGYGRSKMRRFRFGFDAYTGLGRMSLSFGRGTRFYRGTVDNSGQIERWTGEISAGLDHQNESRHWQFRAYHLDWHTQDFIHPQTSDASRDGMSLSRTPADGGLSFSLVGEQWTARFDEDPPLTGSATPPNTGLGRLRLGHRSSSAAMLSLRLEAELATASHSSDRYSGAGLAALGLGRKDRTWLELSAARSVRAPTLLEFGGFMSWDMVGGFFLTRQGAGELPFEAHERLRLSAGGGGHGLDWELGIESWRLRDGIGWVPETLNAVDGRAFTVGGLSTNTQQITAQLEWGTGRPEHGLLLDLNAHYVLDELEKDESRGAGWPEAGAYLRLRWWHQLFGPRDQLRLQYRMRYMGKRYDDLLAPYAAPGELAASSFRHDLRGSIQLRDAELYLEMRNFPNLTIIEVTGTRRRGWDLIWGMSWPLYN